MNDTTILVVSVSLTVICSIAMVLSIRFIFGRSQLYQTDKTVTVIPRKLSSYWIYGKKNPEAASVLNHNTRHNFDYAGSSKKKPKYLIHWRNSMKTRKNKIYAYKTLNTTFKKTHTATGPKPMEKRTVKFKKGPVDVQTYAMQSHKTSRMPWASYKNTKPLVNTINASFVDNERDTIYDRYSNHRPTNY